MWTSFGLIDTCIDHDLAELSLNCNSIGRLIKHMISAATFQTAFIIYIYLASCILLFVLLFSELMTSK